LVRTSPLVRRQWATGRQRSSNAIVRGAGAGTSPDEARMRVRHSPFSRSPSGVIWNARDAPGHISAAVDRA